MSDLIDAILAWPPTRQQLTDAVRAACQQAAIPLPSDVDLRLAYLLTAFVRPAPPRHVLRRCKDAREERAHRLAVAIYDRCCPPWMRLRRSTAHGDYLYCDTRALLCWCRALIRDVSESMPSWWLEPWKAARQQETEEQEGDRWDGLA